MAEPERPRRRWPRRLLLLAAVVGATLAYRGRKLAEAEHLHPVPPPAN